jgi:Na+-transporting NADH:ubiquinone oxidoreductase subunit NqrB
MKRLMFFVLLALFTAMMVYGVTQYELQETRGNASII